MLKFFQRLFCQHQWAFFRNVYGDEIIMMGYKRSVWKCDKCGKFERHDQLHNEPPAPTPQKEPT